MLFSYIHYSKINLGYLLNLAASPQISIKLCLFDAFLHEIKESGRKRFTNLGRQKFSSYQFSIHTHLAYEVSLIFSVSYYIVIFIIRLNLVRQRFNRYQFFYTHTYYFGI